MQGMCRSLQRSSKVQYPYPIPPSNIPNPHSTPLPTQTPTKLVAVPHSLVVKSVGVTSKIWHTGEFQAQLIMHSYLQLSILFSLVSPSNGVGILWNDYFLVTEFLTPYWWHVFVFLLPATIFKLSHFQNTNRRNGRGRRHCMAYWNEVLPIFVRCCHRIRGCICHLEWIQCRINCVTSRSEVERCW